MNRNRKEMHIKNRKERENRKTERRKEDLRGILSAVRIYRLLSIITKIKHKMKEKYSNISTLKTKVLSQMRKNE